MTVRTRTLQSLAVLVSLAALAACSAPDKGLRHTEEKAIDLQTVQLACGDAYWRMSCTATTTGAQGRPSCDASTLTVRRPASPPDAAAVAVSVPAEMGTDRSAAGMACVQGADQQHYVVVQYAKLPSDCAFCEFYYLYDSQGRQLTQSVPPVLETNGRQVPNNKAFDAKSKALELPRAKLTYLK